MLTPSLVLLLLFGAVFFLVLILHISTRKPSKPSKGSRAPTKRGFSKPSDRPARSMRTRTVSKKSEASRSCCAGCWSLCWIYCCPPCPCCIKNKAAFRPPPPSYSIESRSGGKSFKSGSLKRINGILKMRPNAKWQFTRQDLNLFAAFHVCTAHGERIACLYFPGDAKTNPKYTILFSHGNATDLGMMASLYLIMSRLLHVNIFSYDYDGYGASSGSPTEQNINADIDAAYKALTERFGAHPKKIILYGQSIGSAPTIDLASRTRGLGGVVIQSGLSSACRAFCPACACCSPCDAFSNLSKMSTITAPVLVIHGTADEIVPVENGTELYQAAPRTVEPCWIQGAGHNGLVLFNEFYNRMKMYLIELEQIDNKLLEI